ncbi:MAG TPA: isocitrate lyase/phosphoenolpyruvate mutase family protein, partial [Burkholderiaceae bacterium]|nr:isocitrate lyase/phosphoenolpyruvate mutase family protein [Burkholderiaceae bacterium]
MNQADKAQRFRALHEAPAAFVVGNAWDAGSARLLAGAGFVALATSSGATAGVLGRRDGALSRDEALACAHAVSEACDVPVSGDLENGFGHEPSQVAETIQLAAAAGLVGGSIEDFSGEALYPMDQALLRIEAAVQAARALPFHFTLTARCENFLRGNPNLDDTIA